RCAVQARSAERVAQAGACLVDIEALVETRSDVAGIVEHLAAVDAGETISGIEFQRIGQAIGCASHQRPGETPALAAAMHPGTIFGLVGQVIPLAPGAADTATAIGRHAS